MTPVTYAAQSSHVAPDGRGTEETWGAPGVKEGGQEAVLMLLPPDLVSPEEGGVPFTSWQHASTVWPETKVLRWPKVFIRHLLTVHPGSLQFRFLRTRLHTGHDTQLWFSNFILWNEVNTLRWEQSKERGGKRKQIMAGSWLWRTRRYEDTQTQFDEVALFL